MFYQPNNYHNNSLLHPNDELYMHPDLLPSKSRDTPRELSFIVLKDNQGKVDFAKQHSNEEEQPNNDIQTHEEAQQQCQPLPICDSFIMETPKKNAQREQTDNTSKDYEHRNMDVLLVSCVKRKGQYNNKYRNSDYSQQETSSQKLSQSLSSRLSHQGIREVAEFRLEDFKKDGIMNDNDNDRGLNQMFGMVAREIQNSFWQMEEDNNELHYKKRSKSSASLVSSSSGGSDYNVWDNSELEMRGIDTQNWIDLKQDQPTPFTLFHLYKARAGQIDGVPISNQQVLRIMDRFVQNKKAQNIHQYPWFCFDDRLGYVHLQSDLAKEPLCMQFIEKYQEQKKVLEQQKQQKQDIIQQQPYISAGNVVVPPSSFVIDPKLNRKQVLSATRITPDAPTHFQQSTRKDKNNLSCFKSSSLQRLQTNQTNQTEPFDFDDLLAVTYASDEKHILTGRHFKQDFNNLKNHNPQERCNSKGDQIQFNLSPPIKVIDENAHKNLSTVRLKAKITGNVQSKGYNPILKNQNIKKQTPQQIISPERNLKKMTTNIDKTPVLKRTNPKQISDITSTLQKAKLKRLNPSLRQPSLDMKSNNNIQSTITLNGNDKTSKKGSSIDKSTSIIKSKSKSKSKEPKKFTSPNKCMSVGIEKKKNKQEHKITFNSTTTLNQHLTVVKQAKTTNNITTPHNPSHQPLTKHPCTVQSSSTVSGSTCRKNFLNYFSADYEAELKKRRFVSSSCDRVPKLHHAMVASPDSNRKKISTPQRQIQSTVVNKHCPVSVQRLNQFSSCPNNLKTTAGNDNLQTIRSKGPMKSSRCLFQWQEPQIVTSEFTVGEHKKEDIYTHGSQENQKCNETFDPALISENIDFSQFYYGQNIPGKVNKLGQINQKENLNKILDPKEIEHKEGIQREQEKNKLSEILKQLNEYQCDFQRMCQLKGITDSISSARQFRQQEFGQKHNDIGVASKINENSRQAEEKIFKNRLGFFKALKNKQISQKPYLIV